MKFYKCLALASMLCILFCALATKKVLPNIDIALSDAFIIIVFVLSVAILRDFLDYLIVRKLKKIIKYQHFQMEAVINNTPLAVFLKDLDGKIIFANSHYMKFPRYGTTIVGRNIGTLYKDPKASLEEDREVIENKRYILVERQIDAMDARLGWYRIIKSPVMNEKQKVIGIVVVAINIDNERKLESSKENFIATLTHDFKTPTIAQMKTLDLLLKHSFGKLTNEQADIISQVKNSCNYMYNLIFNILDTYTIDNGRPKIIYENIDWKNLIESTVKEISNLIQEKNQTISIQSELMENLVIADKAQIKRVITNLISNAINYGTKNCTIEIISKQKGKNLDFSVKNHSLYITKNRLETIFEKFQETSENCFNKSGTGLGLYLVKRIINAHNGSVYATSDINGTCTFGFTMPQKVNPKEVGERRIIFD